MIDACFTEDFERPVLEINVIPVEAVSALVLCRIEDLSASDAGEGQEIDDCAILIRAFGRDVALVVECVVDASIDEVENRVPLTLLPELSIGSVYFFRKFFCRLVLCGGVCVDSSVADTPAEKRSDIGIVGVCGAG